MADAVKNNGLDRRESLRPAPTARAVANTGSSVQRNLAVLQGKNIPGSQFKDLAQVVLPSANYADLVTGKSMAKLLDGLGTSHQLSTAMDLAIQTLASSPAWLEATHSLSESLDVRPMSALSTMLAGVQSSDVLSRAAERLAAQQGELLADANLQFAALNGSLLSEVGRPTNDALFGKVADLMKSLDFSATNSLAVQSAASIAARSVIPGLSEQLRVSGIASSPAWQRVFQDLQLADGLGSVARLAATPGPLLRSQTLVSGMDSYASVQRALSDLARDREEPLLRGRSLLTAATLNSYLDSFGARPWRRRTELAGLIGNATSGLVLGESLTAELHDDDADLLVTAASTNLIEPWQEGFDETRAELFAALEALSPHLANLLRGAWFNLKANGPAAAASAANCLVEVLDQTLQALVDEALLATWLADTGHLGREYVDARSGRPTRRARLAYALQRRSTRDAQLLRAMESGLAASLSPLHSQLESAKHGRVDIGVQLVRCHAVAVEGFLINLLLGDN